MELLTVALAAVMPLAVTYSTNIVKQLQTIKLADNRVALVRLVAATLAVVGAALTAWAGDGVFDPSVVEAFGLALVNFVVATVVHLRSK